MRRLTACVVCALLSFTSPAWATDTLVVPNAAQIQRPVFGSAAYFRNRNDLDSTWQGCCHNYWLDLIGDGGRAMFAAFLTVGTNGSAILLTVPAREQLRQ